MRVFVSWPVAFSHRRQVDSEFHRKAGKVRYRSEPTSSRNPEFNFYLQIMCKSRQGILSTDCTGGGAKAQGNGQVNLTVKT